MTRDLLMRRAWTFNAGPFLSLYEERPVYDDWERPRVATREKAVFGGQHADPLVDASCPEQSLGVCTPLESLSPLRLDCAVQMATGHATHVHDRSGSRPAEDEWCVLPLAQVLLWFASCGGELVVESIRPLCRGAPPVPAVVRSPAIFRPWVHFDLPPPAAFRRRSAHRSVVVAPAVPVGSVLAPLRDSVVRGRASLRIFAGLFIPNRDSHPPSSSHCAFLLSPRSRSSGSRRSASASHGPTKVVDSFEAPQTPPGRPSAPPVIPGDSFEALQPPPDHPSAPPVVPSDSFEAPQMPPGRPSTLSTFPGGAIPETADPAATNPAAADPAAANPAAANPAVADPAVADPAAADPAAADPAATDPAAADPAAADSAAPIQPPPNQLPPT
ncbi:hypothetical protein BS47DRAFT_1390918 [Hydnum rufescens UP504]|uniref:Uncharacterized protein n=1 Tax=Hydnum rufescens UP504 TaxID=1448309 RepID=A0A9P6B273_9AGAM|nr:hypothetical protein BS47DRAFT_1390918 [Hydnum rufescens UP504]